MNYDINMINGMTINITTKRVQARKHKKKRINKKWMKRYGFKTQDVQKHDQVIISDNKLFMTEYCFNKIKSSL